MKNAGRHNKDEHGNAAITAYEGQAGRHAEDERAAAAWRRA